MMKYALILLVVAVGFWLWLRNRNVGRDKDSNVSEQQPPPKNQNITPVISCSVCGLHLPRSEALIGKQGSYCSEAHQRQVGD